MITDLQYAPVTSVNIEHSFSVYKNILTDCRTNDTRAHRTKYSCQLFSKFFLNNNK